MKQKISLFSLLAWASLTVQSQVEIDQSIQLTGGAGQSAITGLVDAPVNGTDAVNKDYVDNAVSAGGGGGAPTMLSDESGSAMHLGDAIRYCKNLTEGSYTDWRLPNYLEVIGAASTDDSVTNDASTNYIHYIGSDVGYFSVSYTSAGSNYRPLAIRLSDGARNQVDYATAAPLYYVRCVR
jgi:hypothetical protein